MPLRTCRVCRRKAPKVELIRWVRQSGQLVRDPIGRLPGRGYYTDSPACAAKLTRISPWQKQPHN